MDKFFIGLLVVYAIAIIIFVVIMIWVGIDAYMKRKRSIIVIDKQMDFCSIEDDNYKGKSFPLCQVDELNMFIAESIENGIPDIYYNNDLGEWPVHCVKGSDK